MININLTTGYIHNCQNADAILVAQMVKNSPAMQEIWIQSLG